ncbi:hypothetical protein QAD02_015865 [Eretmocerus hayati]|uniref:Uncharacterized protein n=1 Tax=Eretmocerus hayati TaxID=131215 RepID=A0ACC2P9H2_9HYME|nr:hypothetical protein QAD02_015865 [Eretmocerus hayati]
MNNVCFCPWDLSDSTDGPTYLSLRASRTISEIIDPTIDDLTQASLLDGSISRLLTDESTELSTEKSEVQSKSSVGAEEEEPIPSCSRDQQLCSGETKRQPDRKKNYSDDDCNTLCVVFGLQSDLNMKEGYSDKGECICKYAWKFGLKKKEKLVKLLEGNEIFLDLRNYRFVQEIWDSSSCPSRRESS